MLSAHLPIARAFQVLVALCFSAPLICMSGETSQRSLTIVADPWCPFNCKPDHVQQGFMIDIAREALALSGYTLNYQITNWARAKLMVQRGEAEGIVGMARSSRTEPLYLFPETLWVNRSYASIARWAAPGTIRILARCKIATLAGLMTMGLAICPVWTTG